MKLSRLVALALLSILFLTLSPSERANPSLTLSSPPINSSNLNALFQFNSDGHVLGFRTGEFYVSNARYSLHVEFVDANPTQPSSESHLALDRLTIPPLSRVSYANLWPGITLAYDSAQGGLLSSSYRLEPYADPRAIHLRYNVPVTLNADGTLTMAYSTGEMIESAPLAWQEVGGIFEPVKVAFLVSDERDVSFSVDEHDFARPLFIDPTLSWNTFLGGSGYDIGFGMLVDTSGNVYVTGYSGAAWGSPIRGYTSGADAFVAKLDSNGGLVWNTFLGGNNSDFGIAITLDSSDNLYVTGTSYATWGSPVNAFTGSQDAYAVKLDSSGNLIWNTFLGNSDYGLGIKAVSDGGGNVSVYVSGTSNVTWGSPVSSFTSPQDAFAAKLDSSGVLVWNTFLGGSGYDYGFASTSDSNGNFYIAGLSFSSWGSPVNAFTNLGDAFAAKLDSNGALVWNTFLGGSGGDDAHGISVDLDGNVYVAGTSSATWGSPIRSYSSNNDTYAAKLNSTGHLLWNTFLGGNGDDYGYTIVVDGSGSVYVGGDSTASWGLPIRPYSGGRDTYVAKLTSGGTQLWATFVGGSGDENGRASAVDGNGNVYLSGDSSSTWGSPVRGYTGGSADAFVIKVHIFSLYLPLTIK